MTTAKAHERTDLVKAPAVADYLDTTVGNLTRMRYLGVGPAYVKLGRAVRYRWEDVEAYVAANVREVPKTTGRR